MKNHVSNDAFQEEGEKFKEYFRVYVCSTTWCSFTKASFINLLGIFLFPPPLQKLIKEDETMAHYEKIAQEKKATGSSNKFLHLHTHRHLETWLHRDSSVNSFHI